jgi:trehalose synthase
MSPTPGRHPREVAVGAIDPSRFAAVLSEPALAEFQECLRRGAALLGERTFWNVNSAAAGGGVAEMLRSLMAYGRGAGVDARWVAVSGTPEFFRVTKRLHNLMHGSPGDGGRLDQAARKVYESISQRNADELGAFIQPHDVVILHDPQTAGMVEPLKEKAAAVVWRSHIGTESPNEHVHHAWEFLLPYALSADAFVFSRYAYVPEPLRGNRSGVISPSIDPFSPKNQEMDPAAVHAILRHVGLVDGRRAEHAPTFRDLDGSVRRVERRCNVIRCGAAPEFDVPMVVQVSRWDRLKDPQGVLRGFAEHVAGQSDAHLVLAGPQVDGVADDPEGAETLAETETLWRTLPESQRRRIHLACLPMADLAENAAIVNALQRHAAVVVQKSLREGFGLTVTEAMWKARPVLASDLGGMGKQIVHERTGLLLRDPGDLTEFGQSLLRLLNDSELARRLGHNAREEVRSRFLHSRHLVMWVTLLEHLLRAQGRTWPRLDSSVILPTPLVD